MSERKVTTEKFQIYVFRRYLKPYELFVLKK